MTQICLSSQSQIKTTSCIYYDLHWEMDLFGDRTFNLQMSCSLCRNLGKHSGSSRHQYYQLWVWKSKNSDQEGSNSALSSAFLNEQSQTFKTKWFTGTLSEFHPFNQHLISTYYVQRCFIVLFTVPISNEYDFKFASGLNSGQFRCFCVALRFSTDDCTQISTCNTHGHVNGNL